MDVDLPILLMNEYTVHTVLFKCNLHICFCEQVNNLLIKGHGRHFVYKYLLLNTGGKFNTLIIYSLASVSAQA